MIDVSQFLREHIHNSSDADLVRRVTVDSTKYEPAVQEMAKEELIRRGFTLERLGIDFLVITPAGIKLVPRRSNLVTRSKGPTVDKNEDETTIKRQSDGILVSSLKIYFRHFKLIVLIVAVIDIPASMLLSVLIPSAMYNETPFKAFFLSYLLNYAVILFWGVLTRMSIAVIVEETLAGKNVSWRYAINKALSRWINAVVTGLRASLVINALAILGAIPGIIWSVYYLFYPNIVVLRNKRGKAALHYSKHLVEGRWWKVTGMTLTILLLAFVFGLIASIPAWLLPDNTLSAITEGALMAIGLAFTDVCLAVLFLRLEAAPYSTSIS